MLVWYIYTWMQGINYEHHHGIKNLVMIIKIVIPVK